RADGNTAVIWKIHHAMVDGVSMIDLMMVLHDLKRDAPPPAAPDRPWQPRPMPDPIEQMREAVRDQLEEAATRWTEQAVRRVGARRGSAGAAAGDGVWWRGPGADDRHVAAGAVQRALVHTPPVRLGDLRVPGDPRDPPGPGRHDQRRGAGRGGGGARPLSPRARLPHRGRHALGDLPRDLAAPRPPRRAGQSPVGHGGSAVPG